MIFLHTLLKNQARKAAMMVVLPMMIFQGLCSQIIATKQEEAPGGGYSLRQHYFSFGIDATMMAGLKGGFSVGYFHTVNKSNKQYLGVQITGYPSRQNRAISVYYNGQSTANGQAETKLSILSFDVCYRYFLFADQKNSPFLFLDVGEKTIQNQLSTSFDYYSGSPLGWQHAGDYIKRENQAAFSLTAGAGYWFNFFNNRGLFLKMAVNYCDPFELIDTASTRYDTEGLKYNVTHSNPLSLNLDIGVLF